MSSSHATPESEDSEGFAALLRDVARPDSVRLPGAHEPREGQLIDDHYRIERTLGRGGMGVVFAASNVRTGKQVAIKWLRKLERADTQHAHAMAARFRREARAAASIRHPNVVDVYDVAGDDDAPYLVMELLEGESLRALSKRGALSWEEACAIMLPVLHGVEAAHAADIIHRDLKPDNVFLAKDAHGTVTPKVLDFGIASMRGTTADDLGTLTHTGSVLGTPSYMPLEQLKGEAVDTRADIYALGVLFYELLTQQLPFNARGASELAVKQATEAPTPLSKHNRSLRGAREAVVMRALARKPGDRYGSVDAFASALQNVNRLQLHARLKLFSLLIAVCAGVLVLWLTRDHRPSTVVQRAPVRVAPSLPTPIIRTSEIAQEPAPAPPAASSTKPPMARRKRTQKPTSAIAPAPIKGPTNLSVDDF